MGELGALVPRRARAAVKRRRLRPVLAFEGDHAALWRPVAGEQGIEMQQAVRIPSTGDASAARAALDSVPRVVYGGASGPARVVVALPPRSVLRRSLVLPAAIEESLHDALAFDLDRHTPFKADELYFDAAVTGRDPARNEIRVDLAAVRRNVVDRVVGQAESWGATVVAVTPDAAETTEPSRLNLLPEDRRPPSGPGIVLRIGLPLTLLLAVGAAAVVLPVWQKREYAIALLRIVDEARGQAAVSEGLRAQLEKETADYNFALERKYAFPSSLQVLDEVTKLLPDDTWLTQMEVKTPARSKEPQRELLLRGESGNAGRLITLFEESKVFTQAAPRSPTTKIQPGPGEIFDLAAQLRPLPRPEPVALVAARSVGGGAAGTLDAAQPGVGAPAKETAAASPPTRAGASAPPNAAASDAPAGTAPSPPSGTASDSPSGVAPAPPAGTSPVSPSGTAPAASPPTAPARESSRSGAAEPRKVRS